MFANKNTDDKLSKYEDPTGEFTSGEFRAAEWYIRHKLGLQKLGQTILLVWCVVTIGYSFGYWFYYFSFGYFDDQKMISSQASEFSNYEAVQSAYAAKPLQVGEVNIFESATDKYDFVARVQNNNIRFVAYLTYNFVYSGGNTAVQTAVLYPGADRPVISFGEKIDVPPTAGEFQVINLEWKRINPHSVFDVSGYVNERINFPFENFKFTPARMAGTANNTLEFDLHNNTPYFFKGANFYIELFWGNEPVAYLPFSVSRFNSLETKHLELSVPFDIEAGDMKIYPVMDIFDQENYYRPGE